MLKKDIKNRIIDLHNKDLDLLYKRTSKLFGVLLIIQWIFGIIAALWISPKTWAGVYSQPHIHVWAAVFLGGAIISLPLILIIKKPKSAITRHVIAIAQTFYSALLIHLTGGRIETHFHVFGSLAFIAFYRDWKVLVTASVVVAADHLLRGFYFPQSVYGILVVEPWRWLEHAGWVAFEDVFLTISILQSKKEMISISKRQIELELVNEEVENKIKERTKELEKSNKELKDTQNELLQSNKMSAMGEMAAGVVHELTQPLHCIKGFAMAMSDDFKNSDNNKAIHRAINDLNVILKQSDYMTSIINSIRSFAHASSSIMSVLDINKSINDAILLFNRELQIHGISLEKELEKELPKITGNSNQLVQLFTNIISNSIHAINANTSAKEKKITIKSRLSADRESIQIEINDDGIGIKKDDIDKIFDPFYTTKETGKGTGLGLSIVSKIIRNHNGKVKVFSKPGEGTSISFDFPIEGSIKKSELGVTTGEPSINPKYYLL